MIDYGFDFIDIQKYDGTLDPDNYLNIGRYNELYSTIASSVTATGVQGIYDRFKEDSNYDG